MTIGGTKRNASKTYGVWHDVMYNKHRNKAMGNATYLAMYGCTKQNMEDMMFEDRPYMLAMCILSDAQHLMEYDTEKARQFINKAKYVIRHMKEKSDA